MVEKVEYAYAIKMENGEYYAKEDYYVKPIYDVNLGIAGIFPSKKIAEVYMKHENIKGCKIVKLEIKVVEE